MRELHHVGLPEGGLKTVRAMYTHNLGHEHWARLLYPVYRPWNGSLSRGMGRFDDDVNWMVQETERLG